MYGRPKQEVEFVEKPKLKVRFYPEGGKIIKGLPCRVAFVVTDKNGIGLHSTCQVLFNGSSYGKSITTNQEGRGKRLPDKILYRLCLLKQKNSQWRKK